MGHFALQCTHKKKAEQQVTHVTWSDKEQDDEEDSLNDEDFNNMYVPLNGQTAATLGEAKKGGAVIAYGAFLNNVIEFFIVAFTIFLIVRQINRWRGVAPKA